MIGSPYVGSEELQVSKVTVTLQNEAQYSPTGSLHAIRPFLPLILEREPLRFCKCV